MKTKLTVVRLSAWAGLLLTGATALAAAEGLKAGDPAPDFSLKGSDGRTYKLSSFKGKQAVVLAWFPKAFTGGCTAECKSMREQGKEIRKFDVAYFTASVDPAETNQRFAESLGVDYPILSDPDAETAKAYGVYNAERKFATRWTFYIGKDGKILHIDKEVKTATHGGDIAAKLKELGVAMKR
jgi:peroxiredoxin Q/BCP